MPKPLLEYAQQSAQKLTESLQKLRKKDKKGYFSNQITAWEQRITDIVKQAQEDPDITIALLGSTGVGKSTLINALLEVDIMPTSSYQACTAAALEIAYAQRKTYNAKIEFISQTDWESEVADFLSEVSSGYYEEHPLTQSAMPDKIWSLYQVGQTLDKASLQLDDLINVLKQPLPPRIVEAFQERERIFSYKDPRLLRRYIEGFLAPNGCYWPVVQSVRIKGPFELLKEGLHLVDLPGLNDPNTAREEVTRRFLKKLGFVWLVFDSKRPLPKNMTHLMQNEVFIRQMLMEGKATALTLVGTQADNIVPALERENLHLPDDAADIEVFHVRNERAEERVRQQLKELSLGFHQGIVKSQQREKFEYLYGLLQQAPVFTVSAIEYLCLSGMVPQAPRLLNKPSQTQIPALRQHIQEIGQQYGLKIRKKMLSSQFETIKAETMKSIQVFTLKRDLKKRTAPQKNRLVKKLQRLEGVFTQLLQTEHQDFRLRLKQLVRQLLSHWPHDFGTSQELFAPVHTQLQASQWQILAKAVQNKGRYISPTTKSRIDIVDMVMAPILDCLALDWNDFFSRQLRHLWSDIEAHLKEGEKTLVAALKAEAEQIQNEMAELQPVLQNIASTLETALAEQLQYRQQLIWALLKKHQQAVTALLEETVSHHLQPAFEQASQLKGAGVKTAILDILMAALQQPLLFDALCQTLTTEVKLAAKELMKQLQIIIKNCYESSRIVGVAATSEQ